MKADPLKQMENTLPSIFLIIFYNHQIYEEKSNEENSFSECLRLKTSILVRLSFIIIHYRLLKFYIFMFLNLV